MELQRSAKRRGCLLSYSQAEPGRELTQPSPCLLAEPCMTSALRVGQNDPMEGCLRGLGIPVCHDMRLRASTSILINFCWNPNLINFSFHRLLWLRLGGQRPHALLRLGLHLLFQRGAWAPQPCCHKVRFLDLQKYMMQK